MPDKINVFEKFIDSCDAVVYLKDGDGRFLMVNPGLAKMFETPIEEVIGKTDYDFAPKEQADKWHEQDKIIAETGIPMNFKFTVSSPEGETTLLDHKFPVQMDEHRKAVGGIAINITKID
jgi:two-component system, sporulation sensor kinase E